MPQPTLTASALAVYQPRRGDPDHEEFAGQLRKCESCRHRTANECTLDGEIVTVKARRRGECLRDKPRPPSGRSVGSSPDNLSPPPDPGPARLLETERIVNEITIGIVAFKRPDAVRLQVDSIRRCYPRTRIMIVDNGDEPADVAEFAHVDYVTIEFNSGLSASRNVLVDRLTTPYLFLCDDDYIWTAGTDLGQLLDVLDAEPSLGVVGGTLTERVGNREIERHWGQRMRRNGETIEGTPLTDRRRTTAGGAVWRFSDTCMNFALFRREMLQDHRWDADLRMSEHAEYYWRVRVAARWGVAVCENMTAHHHRPPVDGYGKWRGQYWHYLPAALAKMGAASHSLLPWADPRMTVRGGVRGDRPNVVVIGTGNCGTTILTRCAKQLGWLCPDADEEFAESVEMREINSAGFFDVSRASEFLRRLPQPWILKDPRTAAKLNLWRPLLKPYRPLLLWITRARGDVLNSLMRRGMAPQAAASLHDDRLRLSAEAYQRWPWARLQLDYEHLLAAAALIDPGRSSQAG